MRKVISIASAAPGYDMNSFTRFLAKKVAWDNPGIRVLRIYGSSGRKPTNPVLDHVYPFEDVRINEDDYRPGVFSYYADAAVATKNLLPDMAVNIVRSLADKYDLVICDAGCHIEDPLALGCLFASDDTLYVLDHTRESLNRYAWLKPLLDKLGVHVAGHIVDLRSREPKYKTEEYLKATEDKEFVRSFFLDNDMFEDDMDRLISSLASGYQNMKALQKIERGER